MGFMRKSYSKYKKMLSKKKSKKGKVERWTSQDDSRGPVRERPAEEPSKGKGRVKGVRPFVLSSRLAREKHARVAKQAKRKATRLTRRAERAKR